MSVKKFFWMFAIAACLSVFSAETASACANDRLSHDDQEHVAQAAKSLPHGHGAPAATLRSETEASRPALKTVNVKTPVSTESVKATAATATAATLQGDDDGMEMEAGSCIHGCSCRGRTSHRSGAERTAIATRTRD